LHAHEDANESQIAKPSLLLESIHDGTLFCSEFIFRKRSNMPRKLIPPEPWWAGAADLMARCSLSLREAAAELGVDLTIEEAENIKHRKLFQKALEDAKIAFYTEIGSNPRLSKDLVVGQVYKLAGMLAEEGEAYKATDALLKLAKIRGWVGNEPDSLWDVFKDLSHKDIQQLKHRITLRAEEEARASSEPTENDPPLEQPN
jgi:hypothetical protein